VLALYATDLSAVSFSVGLQPGEAQKLTAAQRIASSRYLLANRCPIVFYLMIKRVSEEEEQLI
jgi:hypothetical protein